MTRLVPRAAAVLVTAALAVLTLAAPAFAHTVLVAATPVPDSTVTAAVTTLTLTFSEPVPAANTTVDVVGADGASVAVGSLRVEGATAMRDVRALPVGPVTVNWRTVSLDGDPVSGTYRFTNAYAAPSPTPSPTPSPAVTSPAPAPSPAAREPSPAATSEGGGSTGWLIAALIALLAVIVGGVLAWRRRSSS